MIQELESPPHPLDDTDNGYGDEEDMLRIENGTIDPEKIGHIVSTIRERSQREQDELRSGPEGPDGFGEVSDPDDDDTPDPEDFFGPSGSGSR